jgi:hypothetical protein
MEVTTVKLLGRRVAAYLSGTVDTSGITGREMSGTPRGVGAPVARRDEHGAEQSEAAQRFPLH